MSSSETRLPKNPTLGQVLLRWFLLPDLVSSRIACVLSNLMWAISLARSPDDDPFVQLLTHVVPKECWIFTFTLLTISQVIILIRNKTHTRFNFLIVALQTSVWIFITAIFYKALSHGSLVLANSAVIAFLSAWSFVRTDTKVNSNMRRWIDGVGHGSKSCGGR